MLKPVVQAAKAAALAAVGRQEDHAMKVGRSGLITFAAFLLVFWAVTQAQTGDALVRGIIWAAVIVCSGYVVVRLLRGGAHSTDYTIALPPGVRRWLMGESDTPE